MLVDIGHSVYKYTMNYLNYKPEEVNNNDSTTLTTVAAYSNPIHATDFTGNYFYEPTITTTTTTAMLQPMQQQQQQQHYHGHCMNNNSDFINYNQNTNEMKEYFFFNGNQKQQDVAQHLDNNGGCSTFLPLINNNLYQTSPTTLLDDTSGLLLNHKNLPYENSPTSKMTVAKSRTPKRRQNKRKDPNEPQKPVSAYALFFRDTQATIKGQNPNATFGEVSKIVAAMWDNLAADSKNAYKQKTEMAKKDYLKQCAAYRANLLSTGASVQMPVHFQPDNADDYSPQMNSQLVQHDQDRMDNKNTYANFGSQTLASLISQSSYATSSHYINSNDIGQ
ncbi:TOX high mobility group box family member 3 [Trichinella zimbabwensis]|uniref:TOX high mobility group box family member 3 n=1 Tax=Trichinella zimbabwensis TaxID=268475 RepID=A0A0V1HXX4_9BILA|nr:TOX high mobility group box family member 3 [Trichinella zimbabwensis]